MMLEMTAALDAADADDAVRAVVVTGAGGAFSAGADLSSGSKTFDFAARAERGLRRACRRLSPMWRPIFFMHVNHHSAH
jgi:enoyl-CoA hydratase/carnithine racemase